jgi:4-amino-4-deoxy-L-arabinose transferase-like glycosyltransferase
MTVSTSAEISPAMRDDVNGLRWRDYLLLIVLCAALYGWGAVCGRPLSMHESRLPELSREIVRGQSNWLLPQSGGRPWLERPPLPHWFTALSMLAFARTDAAWVARIPAAAAGCIVVLAGAWMGGRWFGRNVGLLAGATLATTYELYQYATLAEDDVYLGAIVALCVAAFVASEWPRRPARSGASVGFFGPRPFSVLLFFALLGLTNLAKGPLVGAMPVAAGVGVYLLWNRSVVSLRRYTWLWGWLLFVGLTLAWPWWAQHRYPDVWDNWRYDYAGAGVGADAWNEPAWYYLKALPLSVAPWTWACVIGLIVTARRATRVAGSPERFLWCWAGMSVLVLSLPARKHHHYLVPVVAPWAILAALGLVPVGQFLLSRKSPAWTRELWFGLLAIAAPGAVALLLLHGRIAGAMPAAAFLAAAWVVCVYVYIAGLRRGRGALLMTAAMIGFVACAGWVQARVAGRDDASFAEMRFTRQVNEVVPPDQPVYLNAAVGSLEFFRVQFWLAAHKDDVRLLHNLSYLRASDITAPTVYVVTRARDEAALQQLGDLTVVAQTDETRRRQTGTQRFTLYRLTFRPDLARYPRPPKVSVTQAMERTPGPWCGPRGER